MDREALRPGDDVLRLRTEPDPMKPVVETLGGLLERIKRLKRGLSEVDDCSCTEDARDDPANLLDRIAEMVVRLLDAGNRLVQRGSIAHILDREFLGRHVAHPC